MFFYTFNDNFSNYFKKNMNRNYFKKQRLEKILYKYIFDILKKKIDDKKNILFIKNLSLSNDFCFLKISLFVLNNEINFVNDLNKIEKSIRNVLFKKHKIKGIKNIYFFYE